MTVVCIHQPDFIPWLGFFDRLVKSDVFIILDNVQFIRRGWHHRDKIKSTNGAEWLTIPIKKSGKFDQLIKDVAINNEDQLWSAKHIKTIQSAYGRAPFFDTFAPKIIEIYRQHHDHLVSLNMAFLAFALDVLEISIPIYLASDLKIDGRSTERLVNLTKAVDGDTYLTGFGSKNYLEEELFHTANIRVAWQQFDPPSYPQLHGAFIENLSFIDAFMNCGDGVKDFLYKS